jgi:hypothetical protein
MTRTASLKLAAAFVAILSVPSLAMAAATGGGGGGASGGEGGLSFTTTPPTTQINLPTYPQPVQNTPATTTRLCSFEFLRGHFCEMRRPG